MPAQKRPAPHPAEDLLASAADESSPPPTAQPPPPPPPADQEQGMDGEQPPPSDQALEPSQQEEEDGPPPVSDGGEADNSPSSPSDDDNDEFIMVKLADIRKEVQCPICLGIIRKTRTVMECLHRFCRECIDKSMRLGNNECPACRTHCASRRSLRDDPNYDSLISALYPDIDKYEEEEFAFHEEEKTRNRKIQASIAETFRRQSEALGKRRSTAKATAAAFVRKSQGNFSRGRGRSGRDSAQAVSDDDDDDDANGNDGGKDSSSAEERSPEVRLKRYRRWTGPRSSPARIGANADVGSEDNDDLDGPRENAVASPLRVGNREVLAWGKGGARSQTRHGNTSGSNGRNRGGRINKLVEHLRNLDEKEDDEYDVYLILLPLDEQSTPSLEQPYLCCPPTLSIGQLCKFVARHISVQDEDVEMFVRKPEGGAMLPSTSNTVVKAEDNPSEELQKLGLQELLAGIPPSCSNNQGDLVLLYGVKSQS